MNYMKRVAEMLGVELGEKFKIKNIAVGDTICGLWFFGEHGLTLGGDSEYAIRAGDVTAVADVTMCLLKGDFQVEKLPWKPNNHENFFLVREIGGEIGVCQIAWRGDWIDYAVYASGNCFKTKEEAEAAIPWYTANIERVNRGEKWQVEHD